MKGFSHTYTCTRLPQRGSPLASRLPHHTERSYVLYISLVVQLVKNPPVMWVRSLGWEDPLEKGTATPSSILAWRIPWTV